jgi:exosortase
MVKSGMEIAEPKSAGTVAAAETISTVRDRAGAALRSHLTLAVLLVLVVWGYWTTIVELAERWYSEPQYNHGFFVPIFSAVLLWLKRGQAPGYSAHFDWWGTCLILAGAILRLAGAYFFYNWFELLSLLPTLAGICVLLCGWAGLRWAGTALAFLLFMLPLPYRLEATLAYPMQRIATICSTYILQTIGYSAIADGTTIQMGDVQIRVVQACSGLTMLLTFFALSTGLALVINRPLRDKIVIVASAIPVALLSNVARISVAGICFKTFSNKLANGIFHDFAGWLMMPFALALLGLELFLLTRLFVPVQSDNSLAVEQLRLFAGLKRSPKKPANGSGRV